MTMTSPSPNRPGQPSVTASLRTRPRSPSLDGPLWRKLDRRSFLHRAGGLAAALALGRPQISAGPFEAADFEKKVPSDKKLDPAWVRSLFERGTSTVYRWPESSRIGMPIGGICTGQLYLGGDGRLWHWDIFNRHVDTGSSGPHYARPMEPASPLDQGFALRFATDPGGVSQIRRLDHTGWASIEFCGEYPLATVVYRDSTCPLEVTLKAFSPFIPLNTEDSSLPLTALTYTVRNTSQSTVIGELAGWLENRVALHAAQSCSGQRRNRILRRTGYVAVEASAESQTLPQRATPRPDIVFAQFEGGSYEGWTTTGTAFGNAPMRAAQMPAYQGQIGGQGQGWINTHNARSGEDVNKADAHTGTLTSPPFILERDFISFLVGGGSHPNRTCIELHVDQQVVRSATGRNDNRMQPHTWDVRPWAGRTAFLKVVDQEPGPWGNIGIDDIIFSDHPRAALPPLTEQPDYGTMGLALSLADTSDATANRRSKTRPRDVIAQPALPDAQVPYGLFPKDRPARAETHAIRPFGQRLTGSVSRSFALQPGQEIAVTFFLTWHFPRLQIAGLPAHEGRHYGKRFRSAMDVADYAVQHWPRLHRETHLWHQTWYDSTLPHWFLDRTFATVSHLASSTCYWLGNGRFYGWEGVGCCAGTCTHVWHYAQAVARLFPDLERSLREQVDYAAAIDPDTGRIRFRSEHNDHWAVDGQAGILLRTYREHQMSSDHAFLRRIWPQARLALEFLMREDGNEDGVLEGAQHNTLDADWFGPVAWLTGLYLAALRAGEEMAQDMGDPSFAHRCHNLFEKGRRRVDQELFNGEYYFHRSDPAHAKAVGSYDGCEIDQVMGDSWAWQVGLGRILDAAQVRTALRSLWRYNFAPDVGPYRAAYPAGRWYAMAGEGGLLMCTWPRGEAHRVKEHFDFYFNECMTGFEYQVAGHMLAEGMLLEGLAITRSVHDRYAASRRNPWNEVECGDHYARAMAGYGVYLAACGFACHGPHGHLGFNPKLAPEAFRCAFTTAQGWGTFDHRSLATERHATLHLRWGSLRLASLSLPWISSNPPARVRATIHGRQIPCTAEVNDRQAVLRFDPPLTLLVDQALRLQLGW